MAELSLDRIHMRDLRCYCIVGIFEHERKTKQEVVINLTIYADLSKPCASDNIDDTINYKSLKQDILSMVESSGFFLIEKMAEEIAAICLRDARVQRCDVSVDKPGALRYARSVAVEITRQRG